MDNMTSAAARKKRIPAFAIISALLAACALCGCNKAKQTPAARKKPAEPFVAYYRSGIGGGFEVWRAGTDGRGARKWFDVANPARHPLSSAGPGVSLFTFNTADGHAYYTYGGQIFGHPPTRRGPLANPGGASGRAILALWLSRNGNSLLAMLPGADPGRPAANEFVRLDLSNGGWKAVTPANPAWDDFDFSLPADFCYIECGGNKYAGGDGGAFALEAPQPGESGWPRLVIETGRGKFQATDGSSRVLAARWAPDGRAVAFIAASTPPGAPPEGALMLADPYAEQITPISDSQLPAHALFNMGPRSGAVFFSEKPAGLFKFTFSTRKKTALDPLGASPTLVE